MAITFERDPFGWVHPIYRRRQFLDELNDFFKSTPTELSPLNRLNSLLQLEAPEVVSKGDKFEMKVDVQQFAPKELDVKLVDNFLIVEGKHEEKQDEHGFVSRHFMRKCLLPPDVKPESIKCDLSSDGILQISAPKQTETGDKGTEKVIPIQYTGLPAIKDAPKEKRSVAAA